MATVTATIEAVFTEDHIADLVESYKDQGKTATEIAHSIIVFGNMVPEDSTVSYGKVRYIETGAIAKDYRAIVWDQLESTDGDIYLELEDGEVVNISEDIRNLSAAVYLELTK